MRIMTYNILNGGVGRVDPLCHVIQSASPDILLLCEATDHPLVMTIARKLQMAVFPAQSLRNPQGAVALLSKLNIVNAANLALIDDRYHGGAVEAGISCGKVTIRILGIHPGDDSHSPPQIESELNAVSDWARRHPDDPKIVMGDFGIPLPPAAISPLAPALASEGWLDAQGAESDVAQPATTWPTSAPTLRRDFIFLSGTPTPTVKSYQIIRNPLARFASDHYPVATDVTFYEK